MNKNVIFIAKVATGLLQVMGDLAGHLERASVKKMLVKAGELFDKDSHDLRAAAVVAITTALKTASQWSPDRHTASMTSKTARLSLITKTRSCSGTGARSTTDCR